MSGWSWSTLSAWAIGLCWGLFAVVWVTGAVYNAMRAPATRQRSMASYWWILVLPLWLIGRELPAGDWRWGLVGASWVRVLGLVVLVVGTAFTLWARGVLGTMWSSSVVVKHDHELRTDGPYAITRHPIYTGLLGMLLGTVLLTGVGPWTAVFVLGVLLLELKIHGEERLLVTAFPVEYQRYRRQVPQLIPGAAVLRNR